MSANIVSELARRAAEAPERIALHLPRNSDPRKREDYRSVSYGELDRATGALAAGLARAGIGRGTRTVLMVRPGFELFQAMFALFRASTVPVLIDPGIDRRALKQCLAEAQPEAFIGIPLAHLARLVLGWGKATVRVTVAAGSRGFWAQHRLDHLTRLGESAPLPVADTREDELAAILFTSGSTGVPKGVEYQHGHFLGQVRLLREAFAIEPGEVSLPTFPPFALFDPALGMSSVIPVMDPTRPARADPAKLVRAIELFGVTNLFGSPALLDTLSRHTQARGIRLPGLKRVLSAGAPVPAPVVDRVRAFLPEGARLWTPYGATECLPLAVVDDRTLADLAIRHRHETGAGTCVGRPVPPNQVRIIAISDEPIPDWSDALLAAAGTVGEITVAGPTTTAAYYRRPEATRLAKIRDGATIVHRMGDLGYFDDQGLLWFCGRKSQRVETAHGPLYTDQVEPIFNAHPKVLRSALVGLGIRPTQTPALCVELEPGVPASDWPSIEAELRALGARHPHTAAIHHLHRHPAFPVDIRHNSKIGREALARWVEARVG